MPSFPPRGLQPYKKQRMLDQRLAELDQGIKSNLSGEKLNGLVEAVRRAKLAVFKERTGQIHFIPNEEQGSLEAFKILREIENWTSFTLEEIIAQAGKLLIKKKKKQ